MEIQFAASCALAGQWSAASQRLLGTAPRNNAPSSSSSDMIHLSPPQAQHTASKLAMSELYYPVSVCCVTVTYFSAVAVLKQADLSLQASGPRQIMSTAQCSQYAIKRHKPSQMQPPSPSVSELHHMSHYQQQLDRMLSHVMPFEEEVLAGSLQHPCSSNMQHRQRSPPHVMRHLSCSANHWAEIQPSPSAISAYRSSNNSCSHYHGAYGLPGMSAANAAVQQTLYPPAVDIAAHQHLDYVFANDAAAQPGADFPHAFDSAVHQHSVYPSAVDTAAFCAAITTKAEALRERTVGTVLQPFPGMHSVHLSMHMTQPALHEAVRELWRNPGQFQAAVLCCPISKVCVRW